MVPWAYVHHIMQQSRNRRRDRVLRVVAATATVVTPPRPIWGGSVIGHRFRMRARDARFLELLQEYFVDDPLYPGHVFRRRFRMRRSLFLRIVRDLEAANDFFVQRPNACGRLGFHPIHKGIVAMKMLGGGGAADALDDNYKMAESTVLETVKQFCSTVISLYKAEYLRAPKQIELDVILEVNAGRGFPGMIGSIDCMHWQWDTCPTAWAGQFKGHKSKPTMILEAVATKDLRFWHAFFGMAGSHNDINVLQRSPVFDDLAHGRTPDVEFWINGNPYTMGYYLADKIYPDWATLVKTISHPMGKKNEIFASAQEGARKDVERAFGVFQSKFKIIYNPARIWAKKDLNCIMLACVILHNMIVEDERDIYHDHDSFRTPEDPLVNENRDVPEIEELIETYKFIKSKPISQQLQHDLIEHIWHLYGASAGPFANQVDE